MTEPIQKIAALFAQQLWHQSGRVLGHLSLFYAANNVVNRMDTQQYKLKRSFFSRVSPSSALKRIGAWLGLEGIAYTVPHFSQAWDGGAPIAEKFCAPIIETLIRSPLQSLANQGYITLPASPYGAINPYSNMPSSNAYQWMDKSAPYLGKFLANGMEISLNCAQRMAHLPGNVIQAVSGITGLSHPLSFMGTSGLGMLTLYALKTKWTNMTQTQTAVQNQQTHATSHAQNNMGGVHFYFPPQSATKTPFVGNVTELPQIVQYPNDLNETTRNRL